MQAQTISPESPTIYIFNSDKLTQAISCIFETSFIMKLWSEPGVVSVCTWWEGRWQKWPAKKMSIKVLSLHCPLSPDSHLYIRGWPRYTERSCALYSLTELFPHPLTHTGPPPQDALHLPHLLPAPSSAWVILIRVDQMEQIRLMPQRANGKPFQRRRRQWPKGDQPRNQQQIYGAQTCTWAVPDSATLPQYWGSQALQKTVLLLSWG